MRLRTWLSLVTADGLKGREALHLDESKESRSRESWGGSAHFRVCPGTDTLARSDPHAPESREELLTVLAGFLAESLEASEFGFYLLVKAVGIEKTTISTKFSSFLHQHICCQGKLVEILFDQVGNESAHHLLVLDHRIEDPDGPVKFSGIDVFTCLGTLGQMLIAEFQPQVAELPDALDHLEELDRLDAKLLFVEETSLSIEEQQCWLVVPEIIRGKNFLSVLEPFDLLPVARPAVQFLDHVTSSEQGPLEVCAAAILGHRRGVEEDDHRLHRSSLSLERIGESFALHPRQQIALTWNVGCSTSVPTAAATGRTRTPGNPGDGWADPSALSSEGGAREEQGSDQSPGHNEAVEFVHDDLPGDSVSPPHHKWRVVPLRGFLTKRRSPARVSRDFILSELTNQTSFHVYSPKTSINFEHIVID